MPAKTLTTDELVAEMVRLSKNASNNLVKFAQHIPALYLAKPWVATQQSAGAYMAETFGVGASNDGYIALPTVALDIAVKGLAETDITLDLTTMLTGVSRATVARSRKRVGVIDEARSEAISAGGAGNPQTEAKAAALAKVTEDKTPPRTGEAQRDAVAAAAKLRAENAASAVRTPDKPVEFTKTNVTPPLDRNGNPVIGDDPAQVTDKNIATPIETANSGEFDLGAMLSALDDAELTDVLSKVGFARIESILAAALVTA